MSGGTPVRLKLRPAYCGEVGDEAPLSMPWTVQVNGPSAGSSSSSGVHESEKVLVAVHHVVGVVADLDKVLLRVGRGLPTSSVGTPTEAKLAGELRVTAPEL